MLERVGARLWIARIMIRWGLLSAGTAFVSGPTSLYVLRFLLGVAEAGFFPGMILYLTYWFPAASRARIVSAFMVALPMSTVIGSPLSTAMLSLEAYGLHGWQWMFLARRYTGSAVRCSGAGGLARRSGESGVADRRRKELAAERIGGRARSAGTASHSPLAALREPRVWFLGLVYFGMLVGQLRRSVSGCRRS